MSIIVLILMMLLLLLVGFFKSGMHAVGIWLFVLITHGIFVHFFGNGLTHLPMYMGLLTVLILVIGKELFKPNIEAVLGLSAFFLVILLSYAISGAMTDSVQKIVTYLKPILVCFLMSSYINNRSDLNILSGYTIAAALIGSLFNMYQQAFGVQLVSNEWDASLNRAAGLRGDPNDTAMLLIMSLPLIYFKIINSKNKKTKNIYLMMAIIVMAGVMLTGSRAGFLILAMVGGAILVHKPGLLRYKIISFPSIKNLAIVIVLSTLAASMAPSYYWERMSTLVSGDEGSAKSLSSRSLLLKKGFDIWLEDPIIGVGPGRFDAALFGGTTNSVDPTRKKAVAHNMYIEFLAEIGIVGFTVFLTLCFLSIKSLLRLDRLAFKDKDYRFVGYAFSLGLFSMLVFGFTLSQGYNSVMWFFIGIGFGVMKWLPGESKNNNEDEDEDEDEDEVRYKSVVLK